MKVRYRSGLCVFLFFTLLLDNFLVSFSSLLTFLLNTLSNVFFFGEFFFLFIFFLGVLLFKFLMYNTLLSTFIRASAPLAGSGRAESSSTAAGSFKNLSVSLKMSTIFN